MDYNSIHGPGISNFSSPSPHRLRTVSAAEALNDLETSATRCISTGLRDLDCVLQNRGPLSVLEGEVSHGGVAKGKVTEIYGPPGVGKTALGMQLAASALSAGEGVVWVDASHPLPGPRFSQILTSFQNISPRTKAASPSPSQPSTLPDILDNLTHLSTPTLAHLIALLAYPTIIFPPPNTSAIIIDSFSTLISNAFPRTVASTATPRKSGVPNPSARKFPILQYLITSFQKLAATRNIAVVILSQCVTKMRPGTGAILVPAINTTVWEQGLGCRVAIFRDWGWDNDEGSPVDDVRLVEVMKAEGTAVPGPRRTLVGFTVAETGLQALSLPPSQTPQDLSNWTPYPVILNRYPTKNPSILPQKRKLSATDLEIPDSEGEDDEDYGWAEEDEGDIPPMPPQWQGSEDILVPLAGELEAEDEAIEEDDPVEEEADEGGGPAIERRDYEREVVDDSEDELA